ncbi:hypothetical protein RHO12_03320 [Orbus sturtevantii]|uniref:hypothetical protein n=1 Tax=Orbus sturtevantii TaxID=3074109 RepID=UPI00370D539C
MGVLKKLANGEFSLAAIFWGFGWLINGVLLTSLLRLFLFNVYGPTKLSASILLVIIVIKVFLSIIICMGIYSIIKNKGKTFWSVVALVLQILTVLVTLLFAVKFVPSILKALIFL